MVTVKTKTTKKNSADPNRRQTFGEWIYENGGTENVRDAAYYADLSEAATAYAKALPTHGASGESLAEAGLTSSGYENYLMRYAGSRRKAAEAEAEDAYYDRKRKSYDAYDKYVADYNAKQQSLFKKVFDELRKNAVVDPDKAFAYAVGAGLNEESAHKVTQSGTSAAKAKLRSDVADYIYRKKLDENEAREYALSRGLSASDAEKLAKYARETSFNRLTGADFIASMTGSEYLDYLRAMEHYALIK